MALLDFFRKAAPAGVGPAPKLFNTRREPPIRGTEDFLNAYDQAPWVRAIAGRVAQSVGDTKFKLVRTDRDEEVKNHILSATLRRPNPLMSGTSLIRVTQLSLDLVGDAYWLLERNVLGAPVAFWPIPAHWVSELPSAAKPSFRISWKEWQAEVPASEMLWLHDPSPANPYGRGRGIIQALGDEVAADEYAAKHAGQTFFNRAMPEVVVQDEGAGEAELRVHERAWRQRLQGLFKVMQPYFVNRKLEFWQPQQPTLENLTLVGLRTFERDIQLQCWGVPPEQLGIVENSNRATAEASDYIFESRVVAPRRNFLAEELTFKLARMYDERLEIQVSNRPPRDKEFLLNVAKVAPHTLTIDEWRELQDREPWGGEEGNMRVLPLNYYATTDLTLPEQRPGVDPSINNLGQLIRAGFDPAESLRAVGLPPIKHTGLVPVTVKPEEEAPAAFASTGEPPAEPSDG